MNRLVLHSVALLTALLATFRLGAADPLTVPLANAVPHDHLYLVYSGTSSSSTFSTSSGLVATRKTLYLVTDLANPANYSLLVVGDKNTPGYDIYTRVLSPDGTYVASYDDGATGSTDPSDDFFASAINYPIQIFPLTTSASTTAPVTPTTTGLAAFKFSRFGVDNISRYLYPIPLNGGASGDFFPFSHAYPRTGEIYATGPLTGLGTTSAQVIIPATFNILPAAASASASLPPYQINIIPVPYVNFIGKDKNKAQLVPYALGLGGTDSFYDYDGTLVASPGIYSALAVATTAGRDTLTLNTTLSALANVGGSYPVSNPMLPLSIELPPVAGPLKFTGKFTVYETFLYHLLLSLGQTGNGYGYVPGN
jgi:hypothetical protein